ncbi:CynX/NimT family MFS transporter [Gordonia neofelifaecis]|uniref:Major facilitator superfamily MFS_1 n=1 Tax=Gordonia neofelifaecis NRRL B-59395 TaxID=644548 RepID=F1YM10_9ACTN|nr:MFS transporter [Gordonia neofelifaecis]EGD54261.1 major facilitator superfamily MFS_1 [Gordonia neofelifaecis NRRL B-59395]
MQTEPAIAAAERRETSFGPWRGRAVVLIAIVLFSLSLRTAVTSLTPLLSRISDDMGFGHAVSGVLGMMPTLMFGLAGILAPALGRRFGIEQVTLVAVILTGVGIATRSLTHDVASLLILSGIALFGMGVGNILIPPLVKRYFSDRIALVSTVYITFVQIGTALPAAMAVPVADAAGWRTSLAIWALVPLAALFPWLWVVRERRATVRAQADLPDEAKPTADDGARLPVWRTSMAWGLTLMFGMTSLMTYSMFTWLPSVLSDAGGSESLGGAMLALFSGVGFVGTLVAPVLCARFRNPFPFAVAFACCWLAGFAGLLWAPLSAPWLWAILIGIGPTTFPMALTLINLRSRTSSGSSALSGFGQGVGYLLACAGPLLFGVLHDSTGSWTVPFEFLTATVAVMLVGAWIICRPRYIEDQLR